MAETSRIASLGTRISGGARALAIGLASDPFTIALAGAAGLYEFGKAVHEQQKKAQDEVNRLKALAYTEPDPAKIESEARAALASLSRNNLSTAWKYLSSSSQHPGFLNPKPGGRGGGGGGGGGLGATLSVFNPFDPVHFGGPLAAFNPIAQREVEREAARKALADAQRLRVQIPQGKGLFLSQIKKSYEDALRAANGDSDAINKARDTAIREILSGRGALYHPGKDTNARIKTRIAEVIAEAQSFKEIVGDIHAGLGDVIDAAGLGTAVAALQVRVGLFGFHKTEKAKASALALQAKQNIARTTDPKEIVANLTQMQAVEQLVSDNAQQAYQASLKRATTPAQSHAATNTYLSAVRSSLTGDLRSTIREIEAQSKVSPGILKRSGDTTNAVAGANHAISDLAAKLRQDGPVLKILRALYGHRQEILAGIAQDARAQQAQDDLSAFDAHTNLLLSEQTTDAGKQRVSANRLRQRAGIVRDQVKHHLARRQDLENAVADANNALNQGTQAADETLQRLQAQQGLAESRLALSGASQGTILRRAAADAATYARAVRAHSGANSPDYINALRATVDAQKAVQDYVDQQAQAMAQAEADLATSRTDNPITRDNIAIGLAKRLKALAKTPDARITQQAAINNARRQRQADVFSQREQNIEDDLSFEKIDQQTAIARYSTLLHTMKLTRDQKRDLRQRIFQLKKDLESNSELDLDLSSLKLPTAYEIRRAVIGAQAGMAVTQTYQTTINVAKTADVSEVTSTFETYHRGIHKAAQRARKRR